MKYFLNVQSLTFLLTIAFPAPTQRGIPVLANSEIFVKIRPFLGVIG